MVFVHLTNLIEMSDTFDYAKTLKHTQINPQRVSMVAEGIHTIVGLLGSVPWHVETCLERW